MKKKKVHKIILIILIPILFLVVAYAIIAANITNIKIFHYESTYNQSKNYDNLANLCLSLSSSKQYDKIIKYYPILLNDENELTGLGKYLSNYNIDYNVNDEHDDLQCIYLFSLMHKEQYEKFKTEYIKYYPNFKDLAFQCTNFQGFVADKNTTSKQLNVLLETLQENYSNLSNKPLDEMGNLNVQSAIYQQLGDSTNQKLVEEKIQKLPSTMKK